MDISTAAATLARAECMMTGQVCSSLTRIVVSRNRHDEMVEALASAFSQVRVGDPFQADSQMDPSTRSRWRSATKGPIWLGRGLPLEPGRRHWPERRPCRFRATTMRVNEEQTWPVINHLGPSQGGRGGDDVHVIEDDGGRLPSELQAASAIRSPQIEAMAPACGRREPVKVILSTRGIAHQLLGDFPPGVFDVVTADREVSELLVRDPRVDKVTFTGSTAAGRRIASICGERIARCTLELGGSRPPSSSTTWTSPPPRPPWPGPSA